ncbi:hypothetical protein LPW26_09385 [Rhodopseudomonas sp. HC1]|uniref:hypothetical protein n=1 Tax=Rhodopseudomonas infernalis TaxID=2897386 RepID=UPI001EE92509|nr:hypothetical protein [Rhodopseudomonas infernalis]MCG6204848.1 hypothetical protein [Rhodopseudomonas infernalis]
MEYLSAIGTLLIVMIFGGGLVIVAYLAFDDMRARGLSWNGGSFPVSMTSLTERLKGVPAGPAIVAAAIVVGAFVVYTAAGSMDRAPAPAVTAEESAAPAEAAAPTAAPTAANVAAAPAAEKPAAAPVAAAPSQGAANAMASMATPGAVRTVTSSSCSSDGCPVSCSAEETLASAYCISGGAARLADQLQVKDGAVTARCSPSASSISVACARK